MALLSKNAQAEVAGSGGGYMTPSKIQSGTSVRFTLLSEEPLEFYELWAEGHDGKAKPFRFGQDPSPDDISSELGEYVRRPNREGTGFEPLKFAIALPIYNHDAGEVQILSITQKSIIRELDGISQMEDFDDLLSIDLVLGKEGSGLTTEYKLTPVPRKKNTDKAIEAAWSETRASGFDLSVLLTGGNPFKSEA